MFLVQVAIGVVLFATFQEYVPNTLGASDAWPGYLLAAYGGARFVFETPTGAISDRIERKLGLLAGFGLMIPAVGLMAAFRDERAYLVFSAMLGLGTAFLWPATYAISADLYPPERRGKVIGFLNLNQLLGFGAGALAGAMVVEQEGWALFVIAIAAIGAASITVLSAIPSYRHGGTWGWRAAEARPSVLSILSWRLVALSALILAASTSLSMLVPAIRPFGQDVIGVSFATMTVALIPAIVIGAAVYVPAGHAADRFGRTRPFMAGQVLVVAGLLVVAETDVLVVAALAAIVVFLGNVLAVPAWNAAIMDLAPESHRGTLIGLAVALSGLGLAIGPAAGGVIVEAAGAPAAFRAAAAISGCVGIAAWLYGRRYGHARPAPAVVTVSTGRE